MCVWEVGYCVVAGGCMRRKCGYSDWEKKRVLRELDRIIQGLGLCVYHVELKGSHGFISESIKNHEV